MMEHGNLSDRAASRSIEQSVYTANIRLIYDSTPSAIAAIVIATGFLTYLFHATLPPYRLYGWVAYMLAVVAFRAVIYRLFVLRKNSHEDPVWGKLAILMAASVGVGWGVCALLFFNLLSSIEQELLILVLVSYSAGALTTTFSLPVAFLAILLPSVVPLIFLIFQPGGRLSVAIGSMLTFFMLFVVFAARRLRRLLVDSLRLRFDNEALVGHLKVEQARSESLNESLRQEVEERKKAAERLIAARREAEQANMAKTQFLANMSHDIRTPMNGIVGMTRLALETELTEEQQKYLDTIKISADGLLDLLNDILDFSKIEAGQLLIVHQDFNLPNLLAEVQSTMDYSAREKGLQLLFPEDTVQLPAFVKGDELRLRQILLNLIGNAIKFTHRGKVEVHIEEETGEQGSICLHFQVRDTGIGIPADKQQKIFASFIQADSSMDRQYGGSGLGLAICKQLVAMMGGRIWLESEEGHGSNFHFTVVFEPGRIDLFPEDQKTAKTVRALRILVADDNQVNHELARLILEKDGHSVVTVEDGRQVLRVMAEERFDLVFMDVQMPVMDGLAAAKAIRKSENQGDFSLPALPPDLAFRLRERCRGHHIPIIAMTAHAMEGDRNKCLNAGMDGYLTKPIDPLQLKRVIADYYG